MTEAFLAFFERISPSTADLIIYVPLSLFIGALSAVIASWAKQKQIKTPYTRKIFHFLIFTSAALIHLSGGLPAVILFGGVVTLIVLWGVYKGRDYPFYEALARPSDKPHRTFFVIVPLFMTALGGITANVFFPSWAYVGYLVSGWGDAIAEPVGVKWGQHKYYVPSLGGVSAQRSLEGSGAVAITSFVIVLSFLLTEAYPLTTILIGALLIAVTAALVEAVSHHGLDNFTLQVVVVAVLQSYLSI